MLPFNSLFTQLPLIILAATYMLFFGVYAVGKTLENISENQPEPIDESVIANPVSEFGTFYYSRNSEVEQNPSLPEERDIKYVFSYIKIRYFDPDRRTNSCSISFNLFSRPPPVKA